MFIIMIILTIIIIILCGRRSKNHQTQNAPSARSSFFSAFFYYILFSVFYFSIRLAAFGWNFEFLFFSKHFISFRSGWLMLWKIYSSSNFIYKCICLKPSQMKCHHFIVIKSKPKPTNMEIYRKKIVYYET